MTTFEEFKGSRHWTSERPHDPACADVNFIDIHLRHAGGTLVLDPNTMVLYANGNTPREIGAVYPKFKMEGLDESTMDVAMTDLHPIPDLVSVISGEPALLYRTNEAQIALTTDEVARLAQRTLRPEEFTAICNAVGVIWEMHDDFYDPETGESFRLLEEAEEANHVIVVLPR